MLLLFSSSMEIRGPWDGALPDLDSILHPSEGELYDFLQCKMALWIPSCCCKAESSLRAAGDGIDLTEVEEDDDDDRLFPKCLRTSLNTVLPPCFSSFLGENTDVVAGDDVDGIGEWSENLTFSLDLLETLIYKGLIRFKYLLTTSLEKRFDGIWSCSRNFSVLILFLKLLSLLSRELIVTSSISHFISFFSDFVLLLFWSPSIKTRNGDLGVVFVESRGKTLLLLLLKKTACEEE